MNIPNKSQFPVPQKGKHNQQNKYEERNWRYLDEYKSIKYKIKFK